MSKLTETFETFAAKHGVTMTAERVGENPNIDKGEWPLGSDHWLIELKRGRKKMSIYYTKGSGFEGEAPTITEVLCCIAIDAQTVSSSGTFEAWTEEFGFDADDKRSRQVYRSVNKQTDDIKRLLGDDFEELLKIEEEN